MSFYLGDRDALKLSVNGSVCDTGGERCNGVLAVALRMTGWVRVGLMKV